MSEAPREVLLGQMPHLLPQGVAEEGEEMTPAANALDLKKERASTAFHEAGHAFVNYWHFLRKDLCAGISLTMDASNRDGFEEALGLCWVREKTCTVWAWPWWASGSAAGLVAEGLWAVETEFTPLLTNEKPWTWKRWIEGRPEQIAARVVELEKHWPNDLDALDPGDDLDTWWLIGRENGWSVTAEEYWRGWLDAEDLIRTDWPKVKELAQTLLQKQRLSESEVLAICGSQGCDAADEETAPPREQPASILPPDGI